MSLPRRKIGDIADHKIVVGKAKVCPGGCSLFGIWRHLFKIETEVNDLDIIATNAIHVEHILPGGLGDGQHSTGPFGHPFVGTHMKRRAEHSHNAGVMTHHCESRRAELSLCKCSCKAGIE